MNNSPVSSMNSHPNCLFRDDGVDSVEHASAHEFQILREIGSGGYASILLAHWSHRPEQLVVIKRIPKHDADQKPCDRVRVSRERQVLASVHHPFIVPLLYAFESRHHENLVMQYCAGGDLCDLLMSLPHKRMPQENVVFYAASLAVTLGFLHQKAIVHRDVKLENVFLDGQGFVQLGDFGFARQNGQRCTTFCGTVGYLAPEVLQQEAYGFAADFWSLGCVLFALLAGKMPFNCDGSNESVARRVLDKEPRYPKNWAPATVDFVRGLLTRDPSHRLGSGDSGMQALLNHPFLHTVQWDALFSKTCTPPYVPSMACCSIWGTSSTGSTQSNVLDAETIDGPALELHSDEPCLVDDQEDAPDSFGTFDWCSFSDQLPASIATQECMESSIASCAFGSVGDNSHGPPPPHNDHLSEIPLTPVVSESAPESPRFVGFGALMEAVLASCTRTLDWFGWLCGSSILELDSVKAHLPCDRRKR